MLNIVKSSMKYGCFIMILIGLSGSLIYGPKTTHIIDNIVSNDSMKLDVAGRIAYVITIICQVPFVFFNCKEPFLVIIDEIRY